MVERENRKEGSHKLVTVDDLAQFKADLILELGRLIGGKSLPAKKWLKTTEVKKLLDVSPGKLQTMRKSGALTYIRIGGSLFYDPEDIHKMFEKGKVSHGME